MQAPPPEISPSFTCEHCLAGASTAASASFSSRTKLFAHLEEIHGQEYTGTVGKSSRKVKGRKVVLLVGWLAPFTEDNGDWISDGYAMKRPEDAFRYTHTPTRTRTRAHTHKRTQTHTQTPHTHIHTQGCYGELSLRCNIRCGESDSRSVRDYESQGRASHREVPYLQRWTQ